MTKVAVIIYSGMRGTHFTATCDKNKIKGLADKFALECGRPRDVWELWEKLTRRKILTDEEEWDIPPAGREYGLMISNLRSDQKKVSDLPEYSRPSSLGLVITSITVHHHDDEACTVVSKPPSPKAPCGKTRSSKKKPYRPKTIWM